VRGVPFEVGVFTNLTRDHLDYHGTLQAYADAKARLFRDYPLRTAVIYLDDAVGRHLAETIKTPDIWTYGFADDARIRVIEITPNHQGCDVTCDFDGRLLNLHIPLLGQFNALNAIAALAATIAVCPDQVDQLIRATHALKSAPGRMEWFQVGSQPTVVVDFAHTPDALENALTTCRWHTTGALWVVVGCGGDRDAGKRPLMGEVAGRLADHLILTSDNPRSEDPQSICDAIASGTSHRPIHVELDRGEAIRHALTHAQPNDCILVAGKGHERTQQIGSRMQPYSDRLQVARLLGLVDQGGLDAS
jgi:UDP-N-acetylmuramoyl-L-alanyl-D-glutamate--2,6-diaminopimelate ligase